MTWTTESTWTADNTLAATRSQLSEDDEPYRRGRRDSKRPLIPQRREQVAHPYAQPLDSWIDYESVVETPIVAKSPDVVPRPKRNVTIGEAAPLRRSAFVPYEPRPFEERERERERDKARLVAAWRRKIQVRGTLQQPPVLTRINPPSPPETSETRATPPETISVRMIFLSLYVFLLTRRREGL
jgi:hypothetical protein